MVRGRDFVVPDDLKALAVPAFAHRLVLSTEAWVRGVTGRQVIASCLERVPLPASLTDDDRVALRRD